MHLDIQVVQHPPVSLHVWDFVYNIKKISFICQNYEISRKVWITVSF